MTDTDAEIDPADLAATPIGFVETVLGLALYPWQDDALAPLEDLIDDEGRTKRVEISVVAPNGSGKSERVVAGAVLYWLAVHKRGRVIVTSRDGKQIHEQIWPALSRHRPRFGPAWHWVTSPYCKIVTPTGGTAILYTTNDEGRVEGSHMDFDPWNGNFDGPLLIIVDEAKSVDEGIFEALDRCGYNVRMLISSPGVKEGTFYESQTRFRDAPYICVQAGLVDCPHIPRSKIDSILAKYGPDDPFTRSTLYGEFMDSSMRQRFDRDALARIKRSILEHNHTRRDGKIIPQPGGDGKTVTLVPCVGFSDPTAWLRFWEPLIPGCRYLIACDSSSGAEQQAGSDDPDPHSVVVLRDAYFDDWDVLHLAAVVARIIPPCHWHNEVLAERLAYLSRWIGNGMVCIEANNTGLAIIELCKPLGVPLYHRSDGDTRKPGFLTTRATKPLIVAGLAQALKEHTLEIWDQHLSDELGWFVNHPDGTERAEPGLHDDDVIATCIGRHALASGTIHRPNRVLRRETAPRLVGSAS